MVYRLEPPWVQLADAISRLALVADKLDALTVVLSRKPAVEVQPTLVFSTSGDFGTVSTAASDRIIDVTKSWPTNQWAGCRVTIVDGQCAGETRTISSNTQTTLILSEALDYDVTPSDTYVIQMGQLGYDSQGVGLYSILEYSAKAGTDKNFYAVDEDTAPGEGVQIIYTVPSTKTALYLCGLSFAMNYAGDAAAEYNQIGLGRVYDYATELPLVEFGGNGGGVAILSKPLPIASGRRVALEAFNESNHNAMVSISAWGYEID
jgi:hypothetical protein